MDDASDQRAAVSSPAAKTGWAHRPWFLALVLAVVTFVAYQPTWHAGFIWDDDTHVTENANLRSLHGLYRIWFEPLADQQYYPLQLTSFWIEYHLWGLRPFGYHAVNILLHVLNALLLWMVLQELNVPGAWLAAAIFVVHPVQVESVAWVSELKNLLSTTFYLGALLAFFRFRPLSGEGQAGSPSWSSYWLAIALFLCALLSKTVACTLPAVLVLLLWWKRGRVERRDVGVLSPMFLLGITFGLMTAWLEKHHVGASGPEWSLSLLQRCLLAGRALWFYAGKLFWPHPLIFIYPRWEIDPGAWWQYSLPAAALAVLVALWWLRSRIGRGPLVAALCFGCTLFPALGFFDVFPFRYSYVADHFQYLASVGIIALAVAAVGVVVRQRPGQIAAGAIAITVLGVLSWQHCQVFHDEETLWRDVIARNPGGAIGHGNLAALLVKRGDYAEALQQCQETLRLKPDDASAHDNWGSILLKTGKPQEAIEQYARAVQLKPDNAEAQYNYGNALFQIGRVEEAIGHYEQAVRIKPNLAAAQYNLGNALLHVGRAPEAIGHYEQAVEFSPDDAEAYNKLGTALALVGRVREAIPEYEQALRLRPDNREAPNNLAWLLATVPPEQGGDPGRAVAVAQRACEMTGRRMAVPLDTLAVAYAAAGRFEEAIHAAEESVALARAAGQTQLVADVQVQVNLFRAGQPYRGRADSR